MRRDQIFRHAFTSIPFSVIESTILWFVHPKSWILFQKLIVIIRKQLLQGYERDQSLLTPEELEFITKRAHTEMKRNLVYPLTGLVLTSMCKHQLDTFSDTWSNSYCSSKTWWFWSCKNWNDFFLVCHECVFLYFLHLNTLAVFALSSSYGAVANYRDMASGLMKLQNSPIADRTIYT